MNYFAIGLLSLLIYLLVYGLVERICRCAENCAMYKHITPEEVRDIFNARK